MAGPAKHMKGMVGNGDFFGWVSMRQRGRGSWRSWLGTTWGAWVLLCRLWVFAGFRCQRGDEVSMVVRVALTVGFNGLGFGWSAVWNRMDLTVVAYSNDGVVLVGLVALFWVCWIEDLGFAQSTMTTNTKTIKFLNITDWLKENDKWDIEQHPIASRVVTEYSFNLRMMIHTQW